MMATRCNPVQGTSHLARPMRNPSFGQKFPRKERTIPVSCRSSNGPLKSSKPLFVERASGKEIDPLRLERDNAFEKEFSCEFKTNLNDGQDNSILARIMPSLASSSIDEPRVYIYIYIYLPRRILFEVKNLTPSPFFFVARGFPDPSAWIWTILSRRRTYKMEDN